MTKQEAIDLLLSSGGIPVRIDPTVLFGWREGESLNVRAYTDMRLQHPKDPDFYDSLSSTVPDPEIWTIYKGIRDNGDVDDPILVFLHREDRKSPYEIMVLDGATRVSCISYLREKNPKKFQTIPVRLFEGSLTEARGEMVRRNLEARSRVLKPYELVQAVGNLVEAGVEEFEAARLCGIENRSGLARNCINVFEGAGPALLKALKDEVFTIQQAARLSRLAESKQNTQVQNALEGKVVHYDGKSGATPVKNLPKHSGQLRICRSIEKGLDAIMECLEANGKTPEEAKLLNEAYSRIHKIQHRFRNLSRETADQKELAGVS